MVTHQEILQQLLIVEKSFLESNWKDKSKKHKNKLVLTNITRGITNLYSHIDNKKVNIARAINNLKKQGLISTKDSSYVLNDPLLKEWIVQNVS